MVSAAREALVLSSKRRVIDRLRERFPGTWTYDQRHGEWFCRDGAGVWSVHACAAMAPRYDGDDVTFVTHYYTNAGNRVWGL